MRRIHREELPFEARIELRRRAKLVKAGTPARDEWKRYRAAKASEPVVDALKRMAGLRERCCYCCDSRAADVEHYWPLSDSNERAFSWPNLIWVCPECNRKKGAKHLVDGNGVPLVINPADVNPWEHFIIDTANAVIAPRYQDDHFDERGEATLDAVSCINYESVVEGRRQQITRYREAAAEVGQLDLSVDSTPLRKLVREVRQDHFGLGDWFAFYEGASEAPFRVIRDSNRAAWRIFVRVVCKIQHA